MRTIPPDLQEKINKSYQTIYENANPELKVLLSRGFSKDLFRVYTIHEKENIAEIDVTAKRSTAGSEPDKIYVVYIENSVAHVKSKDLPYDELIPWTYEFELGSASNVAIDFDGYWERDEESKRFNLVADDYPWVFRIDSGTLKASYWDGIPTELATNVSKIRSVKGWVPANGDETNDQGLIIFYLKNDGNVYYRNYAIQTGGSKAWEVERQITEFTGTVVDIALFRTNDFRVGFIVQNDDGTIEYVVSDRNWAGMSFPADTITMDVAFDSASFIPYEITTHSYNTPDETVRITEIDSFGVFNIYEVGDTPLESVLNVTGGYILDENNFVVEFNYPVFTWKPEKLADTISEYTVNNVVIDGNKVYYTIDETLTDDELLQGFSVDVGGGLIVGQIDSNHQEIYNGGNVVISGIISPHTETINMDVSLGSATFTAYEITTHEYDAYPQETISMDVSFDSATFAITEVSTNPV